VVESLVGDEVVCGEAVLTVTSGTITERLHEHPKPGGLIQEVFSVRFSDITLVDPEGNTYRGVGASGGQLTFDPSIAEENGFGHFFININILGEGGQFG
jgi:hypothetical protein